MKALTKHFINTLIFADNDQLVDDASSTKMILISQKAYSSMFPPV